MLTRNVFANLIGGVWVAVLTLAIAPIQVHLLGVEAYGVIGFISTLQVVVGVLDLGLSSTLTREIAGSAGEPRSRPDEYHDLLGAGGGECRGHRAGSRPARAPLVQSRRHRHRHS
jgi:hypothetical protein